MKGIKIILYIYAIIYFIGLIFAFLPWLTIADSFHSAGVQPPASDAFTMLWVRMSGVAFGLATIFFLLLARNPLGYGAMPSFAAYGQIYVGFFYFSLGALYEFPLTVWTTSLEGAFLMGSGALLVILLKKAI
uniref:DUF4345 domain-containing protein n=1 Tax=Candidatus Kentrum sp. SD TaxID=2126332 RepID=A0A451BRX9_9GAMM|nr:MAG: hypothetical protein BECKSD772F_GA0070984_11443 [Candidatus Kentron sp. SD]VFK48787.1 MAG: hypothetical protein BECKSD772E_GA0070983_11417 [Candidatus Kentron sp. SD]VFK81062.1 MAG: hypothetical protein BECKSD772D_GA0070982_12113 [Candidatus Kentron sp. SD]